MEMTPRTPRTSTRRDFLKAAGVGAVGTMAAGGLVGAGRSLLRAGPAKAVTFAYGLVATDGHISLPGRSAPLYILGFAPVPNHVGPGNPTVSSLITAFKGKAQTPAPTLDFTEENDFKLTLTNLGLLGRPDLTDGHTVHWHGFRTPSSLFDGVPEVSIAVPIAKQFTYFYRPHDPGTYMYHCHFEDVEHVQMGMTGIVFVRPAGQPNRAYADVSTAFHRHFTILLNEIWTTQHDNLENIQETVPTNYDPQYFTLNARAYPDTLLPNGDPTLEFQPISSLIQVNGGETVLLRLANLGYLQHSMQLAGIPMRVVGEDATFLQSPEGVDLSYTTNHLYIGPGEARDVLFDAPTYDVNRPSGSDTVGPYNVYQFRNRDFRRLSNDGAPGLGGMITEVRVYDGDLTAQLEVGETYV